jgi:hypothetical protein
MKKRTFFLSILLGAVVLAGCSDDDGGSVTDIEGESGSSSGSTGSAGSGSEAAAAAGCEVIGGTDAEADTDVPVFLNEYAITLSTNPLPAGIVNFEAENQGEEDHEIVVVKGVAVEDLEIGEDGLDEEALPDGAEVLGEIEGFPGGETCAGSFELEPGDYSLVCNIVDEDGHAHAHEGMVTGMLITE